MLIFSKEKKGLTKETPSSLIVPLYFPKKLTTTFSLGETIIKLLKKNISEIIEKDTTPATAQYE